MKALQALAKLLGIGDHQVDDAMHSERAARAALSRRDLFVAGGALGAGALLPMLANGSAFSFHDPWAGWQVVRVPRFGRVSGQNYEGRVLVELDELAVFADCRIKGQLAVRDVGFHSKLEQLAPLRVVMGCLIEMPDDADYGVLVGGRGLMLAHNVVSGGRMNGGFRMEDAE